jgi:hypothetical protein
MTATRYYLITNPGHTGRVFQAFTDRAYAVAKCALDNIEFASIGPWSVVELAPVEQPQAELAKDSAEARAAVAELISAASDPASRMIDPPRHGPVAERVVKARARLRAALARVSHE